MGKQFFKCEDITKVFIVHLGNNWRSGKNMEKNNNIKDDPFLKGVRILNVFLILILKHIK